MDWMNGQITKSAYRPRGSARNPTMNRYLPCCMVPTPVVRANAAAGDASLVLVVLDRAGPWRPSSA